MSLPGTPVTNSKVWSDLISIAAKNQELTITELFKEEPNRANELVFDGAGITLDVSRQRVSQEVFSLLLDLARDRNLEDAINQMFNGSVINSTEGRSVLHTALRKPRNESLVIENHDIMPDIHLVLDSMEKLANQVRSKSWFGATGKPIKYVVNIGIGGSDLGPVMAFEALKPFSDRDLNLHFVSNVDGADLFEVLKQVELEETLFIVASKTFTTQETMMNANSARNALFEKIGSSSPEITEKHFVAVSTNSEKVKEFGINPQNMFGFWDWVGGRYSMESAIGLSTMIAIGADNFRKMLSGFNEMDEHFKTAPFSKNLPVIMGLIGLWNRSLLNISTVCLLPYDNYLKRFPAYMQQLTMESNGKSVTRSGVPVEVETGAIYWGEPGTNGQHSFYQLLHQGTSIVAADILFAAKSHAGLQKHHDVLVSNALSQAAVLAFGRSKFELKELNIPKDLINHKVMPGNRPTSLITYKQLDPKTLGALIALYEHLVFVQGIIWGINSFDQWGVELGKEKANSIAPFLTNNAELESFDTATARAIKDYRKNR